MARIIGIGGSLRQGSSSAALLGARPGADAGEFMAGVAAFVSR
jgi:hypothetical protein